MIDEPVHVTDAAFAKTVLQSEVPVIVDFWAPWCGPCQMLAPIIEEIAKEYENKVLVGKLNVDDYPNISEQYNVQGIPTVIIFKDGKIVEQFVGVQPKEVYQKALGRQI